MTLANIRSYISPHRQDLYFPFKDIDIFTNFSFEWAFDGSLKRKYLIFRSYTI